MVVHVVDMGEPSPEDFSISRLSPRKVASLEEVRPNQESVESYCDCVFESGWVQM
jgi:hypothetical protein